jgi:hypothetical protein
MNKEIDHDSIINSLPTNEPSRKETNLWVEYHYSPRIKHIYTFHGSHFYYLDNKLHSFDDRPAETHAVGISVWYYYGEIHRIDQPALITKDACYWYVHDKLCKKIDNNVSSITK